MQSDLYRTEVTNSHVQNDQTIESNHKLDTCNGKTGPTSATRTLVRISKSLSEQQPRNYFDFAGAAN